MTATTASSRDISATMATARNDEGDEEDDYLTMAISEPVAPVVKETYTQRRQRLQREAEQKNSKSKSQLAAEAQAAREAALATAIPQTSKGFKMLSKFGFQPGDSLGPTKDNPQARKEPLELDLKIDRGGIGMDSEKKRKFKSAVEEEAKRVKVEEGDFRERVARERESERVERMVGAAMRVAERMDEDERLHEEKGVAAELAPVLEEREGLVPAPAGSKTKVKVLPTRKVNVLWRGLVRERLEKERNRRMRHDLMQSLSRNPNYNEEDDTGVDKTAFGDVEEEIDEEDPELEEFKALEPSERLQKLVAFLRDKFHYCFWCKYRYEDASMEGCPGLTEEDHD